MKYIILLFFIIFLSNDTLAATKVMHAYSPFGEVKYPKDFKNFEYVNPDAPKGGQVKFSNIGLFDSLNSMTLKGIPAPDLNWTQDTLLKPAMDELASFYGLLAESIEIPDDNSWIVFNIRPEARWHDGSEITAEDVVFTFNTLKDQGNPNYRIILSDIKSAKALSKYKVEFVLHENTKDLSIPIYIGSVPIISKAFFKDKEFAKYTDDPILASGAYKVDKYKMGKFISYKRVENYWAKDLPVNVGYDNFDEIVYDVYLDFPVALEAFKGEAYDIKEEFISRIWATEYNIKAVREGRLKKETLQHKLPMNLQAYFINTRKPQLQESVLREVLDIAFDFDWINKYLFYGIYSRLYSYYQNTHYAAYALPQGKELEILNKYKKQLPEGLFTEEIKSFATQAEQIKNRENLKYAKQLLLDAGYTYKGAKLISPIDNKPVVIEMLYHFDAWERVLLAYKENLAKIGIELNIRLLDNTQMQNRLNNFEYDLVTVAFTPNIIPGKLERQIWHSSSNTKGGYNYAGISSPVIDALIEDLENCRSDEERVHYTRALDRILRWEHYTVLNYSSNSFKLLYWDKFGIPEKRPEYAIGYETWWIKSR